MVLWTLKLEIFIHTAKICLHCRLVHVFSKYLMQGPCHINAFIFNNGFIFNMIVCRSSTVQEGSRELDWQMVKGWKGYGPFWEGFPLSLKKWVLTKGQMFWLMGFFTMPNIYITNSVWLILLNTYYFHISVGFAEK